MTLFVTAILDLREDRSNDRSIETRFAHFARLASTGIHLCVFYSETYRERIEGMCATYPNVRAVPQELEDLWLYQQLEGLAVDLPATRTEYHDTRNFLILMNSKLDFVRAALALYPEVRHVAWIDFNVWHVMRRTAETQNRLQMMAQSAFQETVLAIPGCWPQNDHVPFSRVHWRFCGGFFLGDRRSVLAFADLYRTFAVPAFRSQGLTWEVNLWAWLEAHHGLRPAWFRADHDDSLVAVPGQHLSIVASLTTIPSRIGTTCKDAIQSLLPQVDRVYLSVSRRYERFPAPLVIPAALLNEPKVTIVLTEDRGPLTKYVGPLDRIADNQWMLVCDDDQVYHPDLVSRMTKAITALCAYQNHYEGVCAKTSGGIVHGYVGHLTHRSFLDALRDFPVPPCAKQIDDQLMSLYYYFHSIPLRPTGLEEYKDLFAALENGHELAGAPDSLSGTGHAFRSVLVRATEHVFRARFTRDCGHVARILCSEPTATSGTYAFPPMDRYEPSSCSFLVYQGAPLLNVRYVNYWLSTEGRYTVHDTNGYLRTQNMLMTLDASWSTIERFKTLTVLTQLPQTCVGIHGLEDIRLYEHGGNLRFIATQREYSPSQQIRMAVGTVSLSTAMLKDITVLEPPTPTDCEKNWIPLSKNGQEWFVYQWHPFQAGPVINGRLRIDVAHATPPTFASVRGSTPFQEVGDRLLAVVHSSCDPAPRRYYHRLVALDRDTLRPVSVSQTFVFGRVGIEFCLGFAMRDGRYQFWYSQHDREPAWVSVMPSAFVMTAL